MAYARQPNLHARIFDSIAPKIFGAPGSAVADIKRAVACLLFGGARKARPAAARV